MQLVYMDPAASPAHQGGTCGCGSARAALEVCSTSSVRCPASSECLVLLHFWPCPDRTAQLEDHVRALQKQFEYTLDLFPTLVFIKDSQVRRQDGQLHGLKSIKAPARCVVHVRCFVFFHLFRVTVTGTPF
jgi:hypothetical protein